MEPTPLSVGKSVLSGALGYAKSALAEEVALQLGVQRDQAFIRDELEMMLAFLMAAHEERDEHKVVKTWVKQVRDVAYDVEDSLQDFAVRLRKPAWWRILHMLVDRHNVAKQMKELRAKVEDVSQRNVRYHLIKGSGTKADTVTGQSIITGETMSGIEEATRQKNKAKLDLIRLINNKDENLRVIAIWGSSGVLQETSIIEIAYDNLKRSKKFECHACSKIMHPFSLKEFLQNIVRQFFVDSLEEAAPTHQESILEAAQDLRMMGMMNEGDLVEAFKKFVNEKKYLIVLGDLSNFEEWDQIKACFPSNKNGSRLIVCAEQVEVASLCVGADAIQPRHKQLSSDQALYAFYEKGSQGGTDSTEEGSSSTMSDIVHSNNSTDGKILSRMETMLAAFKESQLTGRENEKSEIIKMISNRHSQEFEVISICGMGGLGKTTLVKYVYQSQELSAMFDKRACVTIKRPFNPNELLSSLATQLSDKKDDSLAGLLEGKRYLIVLDDMSSTQEWDDIVQNFPTTVTTSRIIVTTRLENIAKHCSKKDKNIYKLNFLEDKDARNLFTEKVFGNVSELDEKYPELEKEANLILKKCKGLPLAIVTVGGFLAKQQKSPLEWKSLNEHISAELHINPELGLIKNVLIKSYDGLPYHLKSCFLYLSIFPEDYNICRRRLVHRWSAEGYSNEVRGKSVEEIADNQFMELIERSMILSFRKSIYSRKGIDSCQIHDLMREISISKSMDENLVFRLEEGCRSNAQGKIRHVAISSNWEGDKTEFESSVDLSRIRSLTVFGKWRPFFISKKMRLLRVLDLECTLGLVDHHLEHIGRLLHLKFVSLRGCYGIYHLPDSWGNLRQLQTLDMKGTRICKLPKNIINLRQLRYLFAGDEAPSCVDSNERVPDHFTKLCLACCAPKILGDVEHLHGNPNRHDVCSFWCHVVLPTLASRLDPYGVAVPRLHPYSVVVPRGIGKLSGLHTLGVVNIASGEAILQDIRRLTQLRKLALRGINLKNCHEVCSTLANLSRLESLSARFTENSSLNGCLDGLSSSSLKNLMSLKLKGTLLKLPEWIGGLHSLVKLMLDSTNLKEVDATMQVLGKLQNLAIMRLWWHPFQDTSELCLTFRRGAFPSLMCLQLSIIPSLKSVEFEEGATPKLELLYFLRIPFPTMKAGKFSGLASLPSLKEFVLANNSRYEKDFLKDVQDQLAGNPNRPVLKRHSYTELMPRLS